MGAPAEFVVLRHLLSHPTDSPAALARHTGLHDATVRSVLRRLESQTDWSDPQQICGILSSHPRPIGHSAYHFRAPNADQFHAALECPTWLSGEYAAALEGFDLVPERLMVFIEPSDVSLLAQAVKRSHAKVASESKANVTVRSLDPWMFLEDDGLVERGQRLLDYATSRHIQILRELDMG